MTLGIMCYYSETSGVKMETLEAMQYVMAIGYWRVITLTFIQFPFRLR